MIRPFLRLTLKKDILSMGKVVLVLFCLVLFSCHTAAQDKKKNKGKELEQILQMLVAPTRSEPGNIAYVLHRSTKNPDELVFYEIFVSMKAFEDHTQKPYIKSLASKISHLVDASVTVETYSEI